MRSMARRCMPGEELTFTFTPTKDAFSGAQLNGEDIEFAADGCTYTFTMPGESTTLRFTFTSVDKSILGSCPGSRPTPCRRTSSTAWCRQAKEFFENALAECTGPFMTMRTPTEEEVNRGVERPSGCDAPLGIRSGR